MTTTTYTANLNVAWFDFVKAEFDSWLTSLKDGDEETYSGLQADLFDFELRAQPGQFEVVLSNVSDKTTADRLWEVAYNNTQSSVFGLGGDKAFRCDHDLDDVELDWLWRKTGDNTWVVEPQLTLN